MSFSDNKKELLKSAIENQFATFEYNTLNSPEWKSEGFFIDETQKILQDDAVHEADASISSSESAKSAVQPYLPLFSTIDIIVLEINNIYENAKYNRNIC